MGVTTGECPICGKRAGVQANGRMAWHEEKDGEADCQGYTRSLEPRIYKRAQERTRGRCPVCRRSRWIRNDGRLVQHAERHTKANCPGGGELPEQDHAPAGADGEGWQY